MPIMEQDLDIKERIRLLHTAVRTSKAGKSEAALNAVLQEILGILNLNTNLEVVVAALKCTDDVLGVAPQTTTLFRLEGGVKLALRLVKAHLPGISTSSSIAGVSSSGMVVMLTTRVLCRALSASSVTQLALVKERGAGALLLQACAASGAATSDLAASLCEVLSLMSRHTKGASQLMVDQLMPVCKTLLIRFVALGWSLSSSLLKTFKNLSKSEAGRRFLNRDREAVEMLVAVARLLACSAGQRKLLKRVSRTLWLLNSHLLQPLPDMEMLWGLPSKDSNHLGLPSAMDSDLARHMELFPEDGIHPQQGASRGDSSLLNTTPCMVRPISPSACWPPPAIRFSSSGGAPGVEFDPSVDTRVASSIREPFHNYGQPLEVEMMVYLVLDTLWQLCHAIGRLRTPPGECHDHLELDLRQALRMRDLERLLDPDCLLNRPVFLSTGSLSASTASAAAIHLATRPLPSAAPPPGWQNGSNTSRGESSDRRPATSLLLGQAGSRSPSRTPHYRTASFENELLTAYHTGPHALGPSALISSINLSLSRIPRKMNTNGIMLPPGSVNTAAECGQGGLNADNPRAPLLGPQEGVGGVGKGVDGQAGEGAGKGCDTGGLKQQRPGSGRRHSDSTVMSRLSERAGARNAGAQRPPDGCKGTGYADGSIPPLSFSSGYEGGNLRAAVQVYDTHYDLFLAPDLNDRSEGGNLVQWFSFALHNAVPGIKYTINIVNMRKKSSLYQVGTRPLVGKAVYQNGCGPAPCQPQQQQPMQVSPPCMVPPPPPHQAYCTNTNFQASNIPQTRPSAATLPSYIRAAAAAAAVADSDDDDGSSGDGGGGSSSGGGSPTADRMPQLEEESSQFLPRLSPGDPGSLLPPYASSSPSSSSPRPHSKRSLRGPSEDCANSDKVPALPLAQALLGVPWVRGGEDIAYYPSPYRGRAAYPGATIPEIPTPPHHMSHHSLPSALPAGNAARKKVGKLLPSSGSYNSLPKRGAVSSASGSSLTSNRPSRSNSLTIPATSASAAAALPPPTPQLQLQNCNNGSNNNSLNNSLTNNGLNNNGSNNGGSTSSGLGPSPSLSKLPSFNSLTLSPSPANSASATSSSLTSSASLSTWPPWVTSSNASGKDSDGGGSSSATSAGLGSSESLGPGLWCLTFTLTFDAPGTYYVCSCYPYSYSQLQEYLSDVCRTTSHSNSGHASSGGSSSDPSSSPTRTSPNNLRLGSCPSEPTSTILARSLLCYTLAGHRCDLLTITDMSSPPELVRQREVIIMSARVHPGETCASYIMHGVIQFLISQNPLAAALRSSFVFKLVPMLNPDGVVNGSYRCSLAGCDLNRVWDRPSRGAHPSIYHTKKLLQQVAASARLALFIDIHGHSTKEDVFFYGCEPNLVNLPGGNATTTGGGGGGGGGSNSGSSSNMSSARDQRGSGRNGNNSNWSGGTNGWANNGNNGGGGGGASWQVLSESDREGPAGPQSTSGGGACGTSGMQVTGSSANNSGGGAAPGAGGGGAASTSQNGTAPPQGNGTGVEAGRVGLTPRAAARLRVRMLPYLCHKASQDFSFDRCSFKVQRAKLSAARVVINRELGVAGSYTLEASLGGRSRDRCHFNTHDYLALGHNLCRAIAELAEVDDATLLEDMVQYGPLPSLGNGNNM